MCIELEDLTPHEIGWNPIANGTRVEISPKQYTIKDGRAELD